VIRLKTRGKAAAGLFALAVPLVIVVGGAAPASADPGLCVGGPFGYVDACVQGPGWGDWHGGPWWHDGWRHGGGDDQGGDD
jgi:hypothetical protein